MAVITGGSVITGNTSAQAGVKNRIYRSSGVPTDAVGPPASNNMGYEAGAAQPPNGTLAENVLTGFLYERQAGLWVRIDTV